MRGGVAMPPKAGRLEGLFVASGVRGVLCRLRVRDGLDLRALQRWLLTMWFWTGRNDV